MLFLNCVITSENATCIEPKLAGFELGKKSRFAKKNKKKQEKTNKVRKNYCRKRKILGSANKSTLVFVDNT